VDFAAFVAGPSFEKIDAEGLGPLACVEAGLFADLGDPEFRAGFCGEDEIRDCPGQFAAIAGL